MADEAAQLITVCQCLTEDDCLTAEEVYQLADWLNRHPAAADQWPGNLLIKPLQDVFADGRIVAAEVARIGGLLIQIEQEWVTRHGALPNNTAVGPFTHLPAQLPTLPFDWSVLVDGQRERVNLTTQTCSCDEYFRERSRFPMGHFSRCCVHMARAMAELKPDQGWPTWLDALIVDCDTRGRGTAVTADWSLIAVPGGPALVSSGSKQWLSVFAPRGQAYGRFGYSLSEKRWSFSLAPDAGPTIAAAIAASAQ